MDEVGVQRAAVLGVSEGGSMSALFAATYPDRVTALILLGAFARRLKAPDYPWAPSLEERELWIKSLEEGWGGEIELDTLAPSRSKDEGFKKWFATYGRLSVSPSAAVALARMNTHIDIRNVLSSIHVPTLVIHRKGDRDVSVANGVYLANHIAGAKYVEMDGEDHIPNAGNSDAIVDEIEEFLTGARTVGSPDRMLSTILFTDIVDSTKTAVELGDKEWRILLDRHNQIVRKELLRFRGHEVKTTGDGFVATFDGPGRAIRCSQAILDSAKSAGLSVRAGLHTGECEMVGDDIAGIAVHIAARIAAMAKGDETLVSSTVKDLVSGSGIMFEDKGYHMLKGIEEKWHLFSAAN